jgi:hypothetical protein
MMFANLEDILSDIYSGPLCQDRICLYLRWFMVVCFLGSSQHADALVIKPYRRSCPFRRYKISVQLLGLVKPEERRRSVV